MSPPLGHRLPPEATGAGATSPHEEVAVPALMGREALQGQVRERLDRAGKGGPRVVLLVGDAGVGKSLLALRTLEQRGGRWVLGRCHEGGSPYATFREIFDALQIPFRTQREPADLDAVVLLGPKGEVIASVCSDEALGEDLGEIIVTMQAFLGQTLNTQEQLREFHISGSRVIIEELQGRRLVALTGHRYVELSATLREQLRRHIADGLSAEAAVQAVANATFTVLRDAAELQQHRERFFRWATLTLSEVAAQDGAVVLLLDDLHWIDPASWALIEHLVRSPTAVRVVVLACARDFELLEVPWLQQGIESLANEGLLEQLSVPPLDRAGVADFLSARYGDHQLPEQFVEDLYANTQGNPFFLEEFLVSLEAQGRLSRTPRGWVLTGTLDLELPDSVRDLVLTRFEDLRGPTARLLQLAAVIGSDLSVDLLSEVSGQDPAVAERALEELRTAGVLRKRGAQYVFTHALFREVAYQMVGPNLLRRMHHRVASALEGRDRGDDEALVHQLAHHFERARQPLKAVHYLVAAGNHALATHATERAVRDYRLGLQLLQGHQRAPAVEREEAVAHLRLAQALTSLGQMDEGLTHAQQARALAKTSSFIDLQQEAELLLGWAQVNRSNWTLANMHFKRLLEVGERHDIPAATLEGYRGISKVLARSGKLARAEAYLQLALESASERVPVVLRANLLIDLGALKLANRDDASAAHHFQDAAKLAQEANADGSYARANLHLGELLRVQQRWAESSRAYEKTVQSARRIHDLRLEALGTSGMGIAARGLGKLQESQDLLVGALPRFKQLQEPFALGIVYRELGKLALLKDETAAARSYADLALLTHRPLGMPPELAETLLLSANIEARSGRPSESAAAIVAAREHLRGLRIPWLERALGQFETEQQQQADPKA